MTIDQARSLLEEESDSLSDDQVQEEIDSIKGLVEVFIQQFESNLKSKQQIADNGKGTQTDEHFFDGLSVHSSDRLGSHSGL